jgi:hypothetical protein
MNTENKAAILQDIAALLDSDGAIVRVQREMTPEGTAPGKFALTSRVTIIVVGTKAQ